VAQDYDVSLKLLFRRSTGVIAQQLFGPGGVTEWLNVEQPKVNNPRVDLLARCADGSLRHVELETRNRSETPRRAAEYYLGFHRLLNEEVELVVLFASKDDLTMPQVFKTKAMHYEFRILEVKSMEGEPLLDSDDWGDNILALLTPLDQERVLQRVEQQLRKLTGQEQQDAAGIFAIVSGIIGIEDVVTARMSMIDIMENKIIGPAIRKGLAQGRAEGERNVVLRQLSWKFGPLPGHVTEKLQDAAESDLLVWEERLLKANTLDDVFHPAL
jgi:hypothetical protein